MQMEEQAAARLVCLEPRPVFLDLCPPLRLFPQRILLTESVQSKNLSFR